jgi:hypothetical protein
MARERRGRTYHISENRTLNDMTKPIVLLHVLSRHEPNLTYYYASWNVSHFGRIHQTRIDGGEGMRRECPQILEARRISTKLERATLARISPTTDVAARNASHLQDQASAYKAISPPNNFLEANTFKPLHFLPLWRWLTPGR